jgi:predicted small lipoprotein YifL
MSARAWRLMILVVLTFALAAPLSACGKKGDLEEPEGEKIQFPRNYPR